MTSEDDLLRESLRDLIPGYRSPGDPLARVTVSIRRRRARRRLLLALGSAASVVAIAGAAPTLLDLARPGIGQHSSGPGPGPGPGADAGPSRTEAATAPPRLFPVARGTVDGAPWSVGSIRFSDQARRCLYADDKVIFNRAAWCFDDWRPGQPVTWGVVDAVRPGADVTAVFGVASAPVEHLEVQLAGRPQQRVYTRRTGTDPQARFFALVVASPGLRVLSVASFAADGTAVDPIVMQPSTGRPCHVGADLLCGSAPR
jgi:hypothetical protein